MGPGVTNKCSSQLQSLNVLLTGYEKAGKTSIVYRQKQQEFVQTLPTIGPLHESVTIDKYIINITDIPIINFFNDFIKQSHAIIFAFNPCEDIDDQIELFNNITDVLGTSNIPILIFVTKTDLKCVTEQYIAEKLQLQYIKQKYHIQMCSSVTGQGLNEGFMWLIMNTVTTQ
uniref:ADP-ribosylation factor family protein n=1 Tax=Trepomonas sp. PC1 TaxID=1076344 RepID=A0A146KFZ7_9EUKA|eukprot:JAP95623.1 ADP-ribosylation factor family protein [Trepomonas sp. PC1]